MIAIDASITGELAAPTFRIALLSSGMQMVFNCYIGASKSHSDSSPSLTRI